VLDVDIDLGVIVGNSAVRVGVADEVAVGFGVGCW
jgi:hypothetical protein